MQGKNDALAFSFFTVDVGFLRELEAFVQELQALHCPGGPLPEGLVQTCMRAYLERHCTPDALLSGLHHEIQGHEYSDRQVSSAQMREVNTAIRHFQLVREERRA